MKETITLKQAGEIIDRVDRFSKPVPFDISFRTYNRFTKTGGKLITYLKVVKHRQTSFTPSKKNKNTGPYKKLSPYKENTKDPNHFENFTRNLELQNGEIKKINLRLIISINDKKVIY